MTASRRIREGERDVPHLLNGEKVKRLQPKTKTAVFTILWIVLAFAAMALIAFAGHV